MSSPGVAPLPPIASGQAQYQKLLSAGFSADEANSWRADQTAKLQGGGFSQNEIDHYWGDTEPSTAPLDAMNRGNPAIHTATNPLEMLEAGWQQSVTGLVTRGKVPDTVAPEHAGMFGSLMQAAGGFAGDLPATIGGVVMGTPAGAAAGASIPVAGETGIGEVAGGIAGGGFGAGALPQAMREVMLDSYNRGEIHTFPEFWAMATKSVWNTAKAGVTGSAAALVGGAAGAKVLSTTAKPFLATGANMTSQALTATTVGAALDGHVPNAQDFVAGAATMLGFHAAGRTVGAMGGMRFVPSEAARRVQANLQTIYRQTGIAPWEAVKKAQSDPAFKQEVLAQDVNGDPVTPHFKAVAPDEPAKPDVSGEEKPTGDPVEELLPKVRALEGSGDQAISPAGAIGRYQIMPGTARQYGFEPEKLTDPAYNEQAARTILGDLNRRFRGDQDAVLTAYNAGPGRAAKLITQGPGTALEATDGKHGWEYQRIAANRNEGFLPLETQEYLARNRAAGGGGSKEPPGGGGKPPGGEPPKEIEGPEGQDPFKLNTEMRVSRFLDRVGEPSEAHRPMLSGFEMELDAARRMDRNLITQGLLDPKKTLTIEDMARQTYGSEARANHFFFKGPMDPITFGEKEGASFKDVADEIERIGGNKDEFNAYRVSLRTMEKAKQGIEAGVIPLEEAQANSADPNLQKYAKANDLMQEAKKGILEYVRDSGGISQKQMDAMIAANTSHVSLRRIMGDDVPFKGRGRNMKAVNPIARMEGSDRQIVDPWLADIDNARMMIRFADRNRAAGAIVGVGRDGGPPPGVRKLPAPEVKATLAEPGSDTFKPYGLDEKEAKAFASFADLANGKANGGTRFTFYRDGKPEVYETDDPDLAALYRGAETPPEATMISKVLQTPAALARVGIAGDISFGPRVALKHQLTAFIADPMHPPPFVTMLRGILDAFGKGDAFWELARTGGLSGSITDLDKNIMQSDAQNLLDETGVSQRVWNAVKSPLELAQILTDRLSMASRIGYYKRATGMGIEPAKAAMMARTAYLDYDERFVGQLANQWAKYVPFFKADVLGLRQGYSAVKPGRIANTAIFATLGMVLPAVGLYVLNRLADKDLPDDQKYVNLPRWQRDLYFVTPPVAGVRFRLGKPYNFGPLLGVPLERFAEHEFEKDPHAFDGMLNEMMSPLPLGVPSAPLPIIENVANYSFFGGKPLVPDNLAKASPDLQYTEATSEPAKRIANLLGPENLNLANASPIVLDNYVQEWTGTLGADMMRILGGSFTTGKQPWQLSDVPFVHSFVVRNPGSGAQPIEDFYKDMDKLEQAHTNSQLSLKNSDMGRFTQDAAKGQLYTRLQGISHALGIQNAVLRGINADEKMTNTEKQQQTDRIYNDMIGLAKAGSQVVRSLQ